MPWQICGSVSSARPGIVLFCLQSSTACTVIGTQWSPAEVSSGALSGHLLLCSVCLFRTRLAGVGDKEQRMNNLYFPLSQRLPTGLLSRKKYSWLAVSAWELVPDPAHCPPLQLSEILPRQKYQAAVFDYCLFILAPGKKECFLSFWTKPYFLSHIGLVAVKTTQMAGKAIAVPLMRPPESLFDVACKFPFRAWLWGVCIHFPGIPTPSCQDYRLRVETDLRDLFVPFPSCPLVLNGLIRMPTILSKEKLYFL